MGSITIHLSPSTVLTYNFSRQITKALDLDHVQKLRRDGPKTLSSLKERSQWLGGSRDVKRNVSFSEASFNSVDRVTRKLEQLRQERMERLKELARFNTLKEEAEEVSLFRIVFEESGFWEESAQQWLLCSRFFDLIW